MRFNAVLLFFTMLLTGSAFQTATAQTQTDISTQATAQTGAALPAGVERGASVEGITEYRLQNGLRVLLFPDPTKQTITVNVTYLVGSKHENYGETGMAHLLEHLMFKGSPRHPKQDAEANAHGARLNGTTWFDRTNYIETFPASDENLSWALDLEADRMLNANVTKKDLESEFSVVRNEFEQGENDPRGVLLDKIMATAYQWHNYGKTTIGARSDIENVEIERLQAFYRNYYQPDNAVLVIAGKLDEAKTVEMVGKYFAPLPRPTRQLPKFYTAEPVQDGERQITVRRVGDTGLVMTGYHVPPGTHPDFAAVDLLWQVLGSTPSGRLHKALVEGKKASSIVGYSFGLKEPGFGVFNAEVRKEMNLEAARDAMLQTVENIHQNPLTAEEVERARNNLLKQIELNFNNPEAIAVEMSDWAAAGDWRFFFVYRDRLKAAKLEDVRRAAAAYLKPANRTLAFFVPTEKPDRAEIPRLSDAEVAAVVRDYKGGAPVAAGETFDPTPTNIETRTQRTSVGGLKIALLPKENRGDTVYASLNLRFGDEKSLLNRAAAGTFVGQMLLRGTAKRTRQQVQDELDRLRARVNVIGSATGARVGIETTRQSLPAVMRLIAEVLREPIFPESEFEQLRQETLADIESQKSEPSFVAANTISRHFNKYPKGDARYIQTADERITDVKAVTLADLREFHADFYGASNGELAVVGDFDPKEISALTGELFGGWKSSRPFARLNRQFYEIAAVNRSVETPDKENAVFQARLDLKLRDDDPDYPALALANFILGGSFTSRLTQRLREKEGYSYSVGSNFAADSLDQYGALNVRAIYAPQNAEKLEAAYKEEIQRMVKDGFTPEEVTEAKSGLLEINKVVRSQDNRLAGKIGDYLFLDRTLTWDAEFERNLAALTPEQVNAAMRKYFTPDKITIIKAGDFAKLKATTSVK